MSDPTANAADQIAQADSHVLHGSKQLPDFVTAILRDVLAEIAGGDALCKTYALAQRCHDQTGDQQRGAQAQHHGGRAHDAQQHQRALGVGEHAGLGTCLG